MKTGILAVVAAVLAVVAVAFAFHFELSARSRIDSELRGLRTRTVTDLDRHLISPVQAAAIERRLGQARAQIQRDDVLGAQKLLSGVKAALRTGTRAA